MTTTTTSRKDSVHSQNHLSPDQPIYDVAIIGAGPCGLGVAARLREQHPSALFTDVEQARYHWINRHGHQTTVRGWKRGRWGGRTTPPKRNGRPSTSSNRPSMLVLDSSGDKWMSKWHALFEKLQIEHLRSPMFFHPDPGDRDALLAFVHEQGGLGERACAVEICGCVGKELSKHQRKKRVCRKKKEGITQAVTTVDERDRKDYFAPSSTCFRDFCAACARRYDLDDPTLIRQDTLTSLSYGAPDSHHPDRPANLFTLHTASGATHRARTVVLSIGAGAPCIPAPFAQLQHQLGGNLPSANHAMDLATHALLSGSLGSKIRARQRTAALVIGGGLTSAQVAENLLRAGVTSVYLLLRGRLKVKPFDVDLGWMGKFQNQKKAEFWTAESFEERLHMVRAARDGGSMPSRSVRRLREWEAKAGRLKWCLHTTVTAAAYRAETARWSVETRPVVEGMPEFDHVFFATGAQGGIQDLPFLSSFLEQHPIESVKGLPILTDDLQWGKDIPLFVTGRMASLQLGPGAGNLEGARLGAERVVWAIEDYLHGRSGDGKEEVEKSKRERLDEEYAAGVGSKYSMLEGME